MLRGWDFWLWFQGLDVSGHRDLKQTLNPKLETLKPLNP